MSYSKVVHIRCDGPGCYELTVSPHTAKVTRRSARERLGWHKVSDHGFDFCTPECEQKFMLSHEVRRRHEDNLRAEAARKALKEVDNLANFVGKQSD